ncbi:MAG: type II toxin-antitoxin system PemK/MazF family toxin [Chloroflexi bacterium]|nr:type II toxin-antitoxin system PemK/MazF family toxin [Chloroflexota bacterium]
MRRGEVWWAQLAAPLRRRPVLLLSRDIAYKVRTSITVAPVTRTVRGIPVEIALGPEDGMPESCVVNVDNTMTVPKSALTSRITTLTGEKMAAVSKAIVFAVDLAVQN